MKKLQLGIRRMKKLQLGIRRMKKLQLRMLQFLGFNQRLIYFQLLELDSALKTEDKEPSLFFGLINSWKPCCDVLTQRLALK